MRLGLQAIARIFDWSDNDIQINELLNYSKSIIENDIANMINNRQFLNKASTATAVMRHFVILIHETQPYMEYGAPFVIHNKKSGVTHKSFEEMARYWNRIKNHIDDDDAFRIAFEQAIHNYHITRKEAPMYLKDFLKTDHVDLNKSPMFRQLIKNLKKERTHAHHQKH